LRGGRAAGKQQSGESEGAAHGRMMAAHRRRGKLAGSGRRR
jgi:hypothetical protein